MPTNPILDPELKQRILTGAAGLESNPADLASQGETIRGLADLAVKKAEGLEYGKLRVYDCKTMLSLAAVILSLSALFWVAGPFIASWIDAWKGNPQHPAPAAQTAPSPAQAPAIGH